MSEKETMILCVGLTPTIQRTLFFAEPITLGGVNRARTVLVTASGKAVNVARVITMLGGSARLVQFLGGDSGRFVAQVLTDTGIRAENIYTEEDALTRTCVTLLPEHGAATELVEEAPAVSTRDVTRLRQRVLEYLPGTAFLALSGSFPPGVPVDFYATLVDAAHGYKVRTVVDAQGAPLKAALAARPFLVKPNLEESLRTLSLPRTDDDRTNARAAVTALTNAGAEWALVTMGKAGAVLGEGATGAYWYIESPVIKAINPIGAGDSLTAGFLHAMTHQQGVTVPDAIGYGTACAAANCLTPTSGVVHIEDVIRLLPQVRITAL